MKGIVNAGALAKSAIFFGATDSIGSALMGSLAEATSWSGMLAAIELPGIAAARIQVHRCDVEHMARAACSHDPSQSKASSEMDECVDALGSPLAGSDALLPSPPTALFGLRVTLQIWRYLLASLMRV